MSRRLDDIEESGQDAETLFDCLPISWLSMSAWCARPNQRAKENTSELSSIQELLLADPPRRTGADPEMCPPIFSIILF